MSNWMTKHPASIGETYWQHRWMAHQYALSLFWASLAALIHGLFPFMFVNTVGRTIRSLNNAMLNRIRPGGTGPF